MKFNIGDQIKHDNEVGEVLSISITPEGVRYTVSSKEVDFKNKSILEGVKHVMEDELEEIESEK